MPGGFRKLMELGASDSPIVDVKHRQSPAGGGPSIQQERDELRSRMQRKLDTAPNAHYQSFYGEMVRALDHDTAKDEIHDEGMAQSGAAGSEKSELNRLRLKRSKQIGAVPEE